MKAMVLEEYKKDLVYREYPDPVIENDDDVILRVRACGVCATDMKVISGYVPSEGLPRIPGHEPAGEVYAIGSGVKNVKIGDRVVSSTYFTCKSCGYCRSGRETLCKNVQARLGVSVDGAFAEYMKTKAANLVKIPDNVSFAEAAVLPCGAGVPYHALVKRIHLAPTDKVVVLGVGGVGIQAIQLIKLCGAQAIAIDLDDAKLELAKENGADFTINTKNDGYIEELKSINNLTVLFDTTGVTKLIADIAKVMEPGSKIVMAGYGPGKDFQMPMGEIVLGEFEIYGSRGVSNKDIEDLMSLVQEGKLRPVVETYPISELQAILDKIGSNSLVGRAVIEP